MQIAAKPLPKTDLLAIHTHEVNIANWVLDRLVETARADGVMELEVFDGLLQMRDDQTDPSTSSRT